MANLVEIMDPKIDSIFKKIFGENDPIFIDFVNSVYDKLTKLEQWMLFLQSPNQQTIEELAMRDPIIASARDTLYFLSQNPSD